MTLALPRATSNATRPAELSGRSDRGSVGRVPPVHPHPHAGTEGGAAWFCPTLSAGMNMVNSRRTMSNRPACRVQDSEFKG